MLKRENIVLKLNYEKSILYLLLETCISNQSWSSKANDIVLVNPIIFTEWIVEAIIKLELLIDMGI